MPKKINKYEVSSTFGTRIADKVTATVGSWRFIIIQSTVIFLWITYNVASSSNDLILFGNLFKPFDPFPFIFLNLALSFQAAYTAPIIMMSQNSVAERDRKKVDEDYRVNILAENEIETILTSLVALNTEIVKHRDIKEDLKVLQAEIQDLKKIMKN